MPELDPVTRYYVAVAKHLRQLNRLQKGPVGSWQTPWEASPEGYACDARFSATRGELDAATAALSDAQREKHVLQLTEEQVKARDFKRAVRQAIKGDA